MFLFESYESDHITPVYFRTARKQENVFRGVLKHVKSAVSYIPRELDLEAPLDELLENCNPIDAEGRFVVGDFLVGPREDSKLTAYVGDIATNQAIISFGNFTSFSGFGAIHLYKIGEDGTLSFQKAVINTSLT